MTALPNQGPVEILRETLTLYLNNHTFFKFLSFVPNQNWIQNGYLQILRSASSKRSGTPVLWRSVHVSFVDTIEIINHVILLSMLDLQNKRLRIPLRPGAKKTDMIKDKFVICCSTAAAICRYILSLNWAKITFTLNLKTHT